MTSLDASRPALSQPAPGPGDLDLYLACGPGRRVTAIEPSEFKDRARAAFAVIVTGERRLYGGIVLRKGVLAPEAV